MQMFLSVWWSTVRKVCSCFVVFFFLIFFKFFFIFAAKTDSLQMLAGSGTLTRLWWVEMDLSSQKHEAALFFCSSFAFISWWWKLGDPRPSWEEDFLSSCSPPSRIYPPSCSFLLGFPLFAHWMAPPQKAPPSPPDETADWSALSSSS